jgi:hypothetical protein
VGGAAASSTPGAGRRGQTTAPEPPSPSNNEFDHEHEKLGTTTYAFVHSRPLFDSNWTGHTTPPVADKQANPHSFLKP